ncbi:hypothetical protein ACFYRC_31465 [Streptomyces sp. NPDC005279]|uniref:hypothetical protein n=1 Tax=Streptomyces sp. NPDC005279 TaxID=3364712 RepID=UPI0036D06D07
MGIVLAGPAVVRDNIRRHPPGSSTDFTGVGGWSGRGRRICDTVFSPGDLDEDLG